MINTMYTPVLRWKVAEQCALAQLTREQRARMKPLLELVPSRLMSAGEVVKSMVGSWGVKRPFFLDFLRVDSSWRVHTAIDVIVRLKEAGALPYVVFPLYTSAFFDELCAWMRSDGANAASIRISSADLVSTRLLQEVGRTLERLGRTPANLDVLLDFGSMIDGTRMQGTAELLAKNARWASATIMGGSFPIDLSGLPKNNQYLLPRNEWLAWESIERRGIEAPTSYGDYTVVTADFREAPPNANFSASIRYTHKRDFVVMRGEGVFNDEGEGFKQYPAQARMLSLRKEYCGAGFSAGDRYIDTMSREARKTGSAQTWLRAGINHHMVFVPLQLAA